MRLNLHARIEITLAIALLLGSCGSENKFTDAERDEISDIAGDGTVDSEEFETLKGRVEAIESRLGI